MQTKRREACLQRQHLERKPMHPHQVWLLHLFNAVTEQISTFLRTQLSGKSKLQKILKEFELAHVLSRIGMSVHDLRRLRARLSRRCHFTVHSSRQHVATINCFLLIAQPQSTLARSITERRVNRKLVTISDDKKYWLRAKRHFVFVGSYQWWWLRTNKGGL